MIPKFPLNNSTTRLTIRILLLPVVLANLALCITWVTDNHKEVFTDYNTDYPIAGYVFLPLSLLLNIKVILQHFTLTKKSSLSKPNPSPQQWRKIYTWRMNNWWTLFFDIIILGASLTDGTLELYIIFGWVNNMGKAMGVLCWVISAGHLILAVLTTITCCQQRKEKKALKQGSVRLRDEENTTEGSGKAGKEVAVELQGGAKAEELRNIY